MKRKPTINWFFEPRDIWVGVYWTRGADRSLLVYICLLPMLPLLLHFPASREDYEVWYRRECVGMGADEQF
jgi:hypothetical protein